MAATILPFASILFISFLPVVVSIDYFTDTASIANHKRAVTDGIFMGKLSSAVECRSAIRVGNAAGFIEQDMKQLLSDVQSTHRSGFFRSTLVENFTTLASQFYMVLILLPLGLMVLNGKIGYDAFQGEIKESGLYNFLLDDFNSVH